MRRIFTSSGKKSLILNALAIFSIGIIGLSTTAWAAASLIVSPNMNLVNGQKISISGSGFAHGSTGTIVECNDDPSQPTVLVAGSPVPVSCTNPLSRLVTTSNAGKLAATFFTVHTGTVGPPATGKDSSGGNATADAAKYPCPPTAAQLDAGYSCIITFGDANGDDVSQSIKFASQTPPASYSCDSLDVQKIGKLSVKVAVETLASKGVTLQSINYYFGGQSKPQTSKLEEIDHTYVKYGSYTIYATATFNVNGMSITTQKTAGCTQVVTFAKPTTSTPSTGTTTPTTTPTTPTASNTSSNTPTVLVNTGPGDIIGLFAIVVVGSGLAHYVYSKYSRRKLSS